MSQCYQVKVCIPFQHVDAAGVVFFARLFEHAHQVYERFMETIDWPLSRMLEQRTLMLPIAHAEADYRRPIRYGDRIDAALSVARIGTGSFTLRYIFRAAGGEIAAEVRTVHVALSPVSRTCPLPRTLRGALARYTAEDASISD